MFSKHVNRQDHRKPQRMQRGKDRRVFSNTAQPAERINTASPGRAMRGGIRL